MDMGGRSDAIPKYSAEEPSRTWSNDTLLRHTKGSKRPTSKAKETY